MSALHSRECVTLSGSEYIALMAIANKPCWICDVCGYIWIKVEGRIPEQCANRECRSRKYNALGRDFTKEVPQPVARSGSMESASSAPEVGTSITNTEKRDMAGTRSILELEGLGAEKGGIDIGPWGSKGTWLGAGGNPEGLPSGGVENTSVENSTPHTETGLEETPRWMQEPLSQDERQRRLEEGKTAHPVEQGEALFFLPCPKRDRNVQAGEWVSCSLAKDHKGRCRFDGRRISFYEDDEGGA